MSCKAWDPYKLQCKADLLAYLLMGDARITGVALTGSVARNEVAHDIDLVVFHDGSLGDCRYRIPFPVHDQKCDYGHEVEAGWRRIENTIGMEIASRLGEAITEISGEGCVPVEFFFVCERALWECRYLQALRKKDGSDFTLPYFVTFPCRY